MRPLYFLQPLIYNCLCHIDRMIDRKCFGSREIYIPEGKPKMKKLLFTRHSAPLLPLRSCIAEQNHRALVLWALDCGKRFAELFAQRCPGEDRPQRALTLAGEWAQDKIKMPQARRAILDAHAAAGEAAVDPVAEAAGRAVGHAAATVHAQTHAIGLPSYGLTALALMNRDIADGEKEAALLDRECAWFLARLQHWAEVEKSHPGPWAAFLLKEKPNTEAILMERERERKRREG